MIHVREIDHLVLRIVDVAAMLHFYCDVLGCPVELQDDSIGLIQLRARSLRSSITPLQLCSTNEALVEQGPVALQIGFKQLHIGLCRHLRGPGRLLAQLQIGGVQASQHLACTHCITVVHTAAFQLAGHTKAQRGLGTGFDLGRVLMASPPALWAHRDRAHGTHRLGRRRLG